MAAPPAFHPSGAYQEKILKGTERIWLCYTLHLYQTAVNTQLLCWSNVISTIQTSESPAYVCYMGYFFR